MFEVTESQLLEWLSGFLWPFFRIAGMLMVAPLFSAAFIPVRIRMLLAFTLSLAVVPLLPPPPDVPLFSIEGMLIGVQQVLVGFAAGFLLQLVFDAVVVGIQTVAMSMGLGFAVMVDSQSGVQVPVLSQFHVIIATLLFLAFNGHLLVISMLIDSFTHLPVGPIGLSADSFWILVSWGSNMFAGAVNIALPAATAVLVVNLSIGVISRAAPSLNLFAVGFPITMLTGFVMLMATLPMLQGTLARLIEEAMQAIRMMWG
ncbi:flagellar biosynthetic protein FliR [Wenzhouxiangella sp. AB-CW3]|uniref:flagellar biosynthetic protein FliR n=1 Tax=Wenzhouxiangella sp. AB-CW3 TaxID=2771012 RepID=UPI00168B38A9|nr:flagellar biosynthetic protein FliR [Wenzhouxiangella sp. AB-CW3]QOC21193.1 flagellar biosynthetic protein FliR [Wenzhouxiangella sp. AB-CW3]